MTGEQPSVGVLRAFGVRGSVRALDGGQRTSWAAGGLVFKPAEGPLQEWLGEVLAGVAQDGFRLGAPVRSLDGGWVCQGWAATRWVDGEVPDYSAVSTWLRVVEAGRAFHRAVAGLGRPGFLDVRRDWWAEADRAVWGERAIRYRPEFAGLARRLGDMLEPLGASQVVHGDLTNNVLFAAGLAPAVIDVSPYWRPPAYAEGVVVADAICWHGAPGDLWRTVGVAPAAVARALLFRMATTNERVTSGEDGEDGDLVDEASRYARAADAIGA